MDHAPRARGRTGQIVLPEVQEKIQAFNSYGKFIAPEKKARR
jgi:hypothetical protein